MAETSQTFRTELLAAGGNNVGIVVPDDVVAAFDRGKRVPVESITTAKAVDTRTRRVAKVLEALKA